MGNHVYLTATTSPTSLPITWTSSNNTIATVTNGIVSTLKVGDVTITATCTVAGVSYSASCSVHVNAYITISQTSATVSIDSTINLTATTNPSGKSVSWQSMNSNIATVVNGVPDPPSNSLSFFFSSYEELNNALKDGSSQLHEVYIIEEQGRLFIELLDLFAEGNLSLKIPAYNDVPFELHEKTDWQKITLLSCERYDMPWIRYSCDYGGSCVAVGISYLDCLKVYEITPPEDINLFLDTVAPDSPGSENKKYRDKYPEICKDTYNETLNIKGTNVNAVVLEYTNGIVYRFVYDDLLVSVWAYDGGSIEQAFWEGFSLEEYAG